jgi:hypothetical protein
LAVRHLRRAREAKPSQSRQAASAQPDGSLGAKARRRGGGSQGEQSARRWGGGAQNKHSLKNESPGLFRSLRRSTFQGFLLRFGLPLAVEKTLLNSRLTPQPVKFR